MRKSTKSSIRRATKSRRKRTSRRRVSRRRVSRRRVSRRRVSRRRVSRRRASRPRVSRKLKFKMEDWMRSVVRVPYEGVPLTPEERLRRFQYLANQNPPRQPTLREFVERSGGIHGGVLATKDDLKEYNEFLDRERRTGEYEKTRADCVCGLKTNRHGQVGAEFLCHDPSRVHPYVTAAWDRARRSTCVDELNRKLKFKMDSNDSSWDEWRRPRLDDLPPSTRVCAALHDSPTKEF